MLRLVSLWPYQKTWEKVVARIYLAFAIVILMLAQMIRGIEECFYEDVNIEIVLENFSGFCYFIGIITRLITSILSIDNFQHLYEEITKDWKQVTDEEEKNVLRHFAKKGRLLTIIYSVYAYGSCVLYITSTAVIPMLLNEILTKKEPLPKMLCLYGEFFVDQEKYFNHIFLLILFSGIGHMAITTAIDGTYINCVQHILGLFNIIKYKLEELNKIVSDPVTYNSEDIADVINNNIMFCIKTHKRCLELTILLQEACNKCFFIMSAIMILGLSTFSVDLVININRPINFLRIFTLWFAAIIYLFYISWPGQKLIDTSNELFIWIYSSGWYQFPLKSKNDMRLMMLRSKKPCQLTAGPLLIMSFETCGLILRTAFSYFTAVASMG
ncbi:odorant receptor 63a-like isoform X1 [Phymastichus coffea]|uniref:odorant receptor 63a-like isoform X1 n=1 Tax=Phymastichus coffea TaxID=108790 RepID=UPI00273BF99A|nr:odorant receptor 63a-like isoform X1 [Phymastichus coffea]